MARFYPFVMTSTAARPLTRVAVNAGRTLNAVRPLLAAET